MLHASCLTRLANSAGFCMSRWHRTHYWSHQLLYACVLCTLYKLQDILHASAWR